MKHANGETWFGVDVDGASGVRNNMDAFVWEPSLVKTNAISSAAEAACLILSVDETVRGPQSEAVRVCSVTVTINDCLNPPLQANPGPKAPPGTAQRALRGRGLGRGRGR